MMATEAASEDIAKTTTTLGHDLNSTATSSHDVNSEHSEPLVNGTSDKDSIKQDGYNIEADVVSAEVSVSGGSDTEASKTEASKIGADEKGHVRTGSTLKKFASFKPVSVNKTFLAAKGATPTVPSKLGEKPVAGITTTQSGPSPVAGQRPRLVAKTGSGLRDSIPRASTGANGGTPGAAPDASAVWNKNRPAPPPEPKRFTDEELKQRYGIHLATRLQSDDPGKQANWADIDDDDDDWAPETIEWTDGTKITLPQADDTPVREPTPVPAVEKAKAVEAIKPKSPAPTQAAPSPTTRPSGLATGRAGLILKGAAEKPTLVAKPPGPPTPIKSPWAPLPPVDKATPIAVDIANAQQSQQPQQSRFGQRDPHGFQAMPPPAKEIAADDFSRSWRGAEGNTSRELYNSQSGRYEPVNDNNRRGSRNPAVLQRPHNDGPAEPSAAFQSQRSGGQDSGYGRRRTSSNVSGGSGNFARRMSRGHDMPQPHDLLGARRGSLAAVSDAPSSPRTFSPSGQQAAGQRQPNSQWQVKAPSSVNEASPQSAQAQVIPANSVPVDTQASPAVYEDPLETQKKIMQQKREEARKRKQDEEARLEAEKKERIALKLAAMGPAPERKSEKKEVPVEEAVVPTQIKTRGPAEPPSTVETTKGADNSNAKLPTHPVESQTSTEAVPENAAEIPSKQDVRSNGIHQTAPASEPVQQTSQDGRNWQNNQSGKGFQPWAPGPAQRPQSSNVWGPPSNDRTLGNGTFNPELSRLPEVQASASHPGPIGPPGRQHHQHGNAREYGARPAPIGPPGRHQGPPRDHQPRVNAVWGGVPEKIAHEDKFLREQQDSRRDLQDLDGPQTEFRDTWRKVELNEDGTRTAVRASLMAVNDGSGQWATQEEAPHRPMPQQQFNDNFRSPSNMNASPTVRGSRFFPNRDVRLEDPLMSMSFDRPGSPSPPPPTMAGHPAYDGDVIHPQVSLPGQHSDLDDLPSRPIVKLPPTQLAPIGPPKPTSFAAAVSSPAPQPIGARQPARPDHTVRHTQDVRFETHTGSSAEWQSRISNLLNRKSSPPRSHALAVDSSSKYALELPNLQFSATVSLPSSVSGDLAADHTSVISKPAAEACFEEQEMGSLPLVKVPAGAPPLAWNPATMSRANPRKFPLGSIISTEPMDFFSELKDTPVFTIKLPFQDLAKTVPIPVRQRSNGRHRGGRGGRGNPGHNPAHRGGRGRNGSNSAASPNHSGSPSTPNSPSARGSHRGNSRGGYNNWNSRHIAATPIHI